MNRLALAIFLAAAALGQDKAAPKQIPFPGAARPTAAPPPGIARPVPKPPTASPDLRNLERPAPSAASRAGNAPGAAPLTKQRTEAYSAEIRKPAACQAESRAPPRIIIRSSRRPRWW
jgi:hypothetical protein